jgi:sugar/nucleoside kinase (ribokinase family)
MITKSFAITDGANGAITYDGDLICRAEGVSAKAIDTNGAGDMFAGAFLYAITSGKGYDWAAKLANDCASRVVAQFGPRLDLEEFYAIKAKFCI